MSDRDTALREFSSAAKKLGLLKASATNLADIKESVARPPLFLKDAEGNVVMEKSCFFDLNGVSNEERRLPIILDTLMDDRDDPAKWSWVREHTHKTVDLVMAQRAKGWVAT